MHFAPAILFRFQRSDDLLHFLPVLYLPGTLNDLRLSGGVHAAKAGKRLRMLRQRHAEAQRQRLLRFFVHLLTSLTLVCPHQGEFCAMAVENQSGSAYLRPNSSKVRLKAPLSVFLALRYLWVSKLCWLISMTATAMLEQWSEMRS